ncbi:O-methyltransferase [Nocardiopsis aegyptia]|uniref:O-methyltransferase n=1 Tax=Nocardiopsis aegyptia TaxID=220378 RepID=UPI00366C50E7
MTGFADGLGDARRAATAYFGFHVPERAGEPEGGDLLDDIGDTVHGAELPVLDRTTRAASPAPVASSDPPDGGAPEADASGRPAVLAAIEADTEALGFTMSCEEAVGRLLRALAAAKPGGRLLELGTGTGAGTAWLLAGMDGQTTLDTLDHDPETLAVARRHHGDDPRVTLHEADGGPWLADRVGGPGYDLVFADTWPGKFTHRDEALSLVRRGGFYVVDDLDRQPEGAVPDDHRSAVDELVADLESRAGWAALPLLGWSCGVLVLVRT